MSRDQPDNHINNVHGIQRLFIDDCLNPIKGGKEFASEYEQDEQDGYDYNDGYDYILLQDGSIQKKICESKFTIPLVDSLQFKIVPTSERFLQFIIDDYRTENLIKVMPRSEVINRVKTNSYITICNQEMSTELELQCDWFTYVIKNLDVLILLQQTTRCGLMPFMFDNNIVKQYGLWARRSYIEILQVE